MAQSVKRRHIFSCRAVSFLFFLGACAQSGSKTRKHDALAYTEPFLHDVYTFPILLAGTELYIYLNMTIEFSYKCVYE